MSWIARPHPERERVSLIMVKADGSEVVFDHLDADAAERLSEELLDSVTVVEGRVCE